MAQDRCSLRNGCSGIGNVRSSCLQAPKSRLQRGMEYSVFIPLGSHGCPYCCSNHQTP